MAESVTISISAASNTTIAGQIAGCAPALGTPTHALFGNFGASTPSINVGTGNSNCTMNCQQMAQLCQRVANNHVTAAGGTVPAGGATVGNGANQITAAQLTTETSAVFQIAAIQATRSGGTLQASVNTLAATPPENPVAALDAEQTVARLAATMTPARRAQFTPAIQNAMVASLTADPAATTTLNTAITTAVAANRAPGAARDAALGTAMGPVINSAGFTPPTGVELGTIRTNLGIPAPEGKAPPDKTSSVTFSTSDLLAAVGNGTSISGPSQTTGPSGAANLAATLNGGPGKGGLGAA